MDWPERALRYAVERMPETRGEWGAAMLAELATVRGFWARWRFALGCARAALFPPRQSELRLAGGPMNVYARKLRGVAGIGLIWAPMWAAMFGLMLSILMYFLPPSNEPGVAELIWTIAQVGFISGGLFGILLSCGENGKPLLGLSMGRVALWGALSSAVFPVATGRADQVFWTCPFGVIVAVSLVALARRAARRQADQPRGLFWWCALLPVSDAVSPVQKTAA